MWKSMLGTLGLAGIALSAAQLRPRPIVPLGAAAMWVECVQGGETVVRIEVESDEPLHRVRVLRPDGSTLLEVAAFAGAKRGVSDFKAEIPAQGLADLFAMSQEGEHEIRATTAAGRLAIGHARLSLDLPRAPIVVYPLPKSEGVSTQDLVVQWMPENEARGGYYVELEQDENDGLTVHVPAGQHSFRVPNGILRPDAATHLEVAAIDANGNRTMVEIPFRTR